ncbi:MAG: hypothetical protein R2711_16245 [Acidimicrobiales bacterium]
MIVTDTEAPTLKSPEASWKATVTGYEATPELASAIVPTSVTSPSTPSPVVEGIAASSSPLAVSSPAPPSAPPVDAVACPPGNPPPGKPPPGNPGNAWVLDDEVVASATVATWPVASDVTSVSSNPRVTV